ncbi:ATP-binding protein [Leisingera caerulea]|uniref:ATP-binding protein n=1 Tax=Leisingera caerulea TaxID=506591 RepID=UPI000417FE62|nr:ATP-binding protein [Leisingera caerulea]
MDASGVPPLGDSCGLNLGALAGLHGLEFCQEFAGQLAQGTGADLVTVGELTVRETPRIRVLASSFDGLPLGDFEYDLRGAPCCDVVLSGEPQVYPGRVEELYPEGGMFVEEGLQSYAGVALKDPGGAASGLVQAAWREDIGDGLAQRAVAVMQQFAPRLGAEIAGLRRLAALAALAEGPGSTCPRAAFRQIARELQSALRVRAVFIAGCSGGRPDRCRVLACCSGGRLLDAAEGRAVRCDPTGKQVPGGWEAVQVPDGLRQIVQALAQTRPLSLKYCLGFPLRDADGAAAGWLGLLHDRDIATDVLEPDLMALAAARTGLELRRRAAEQRRQQAEAAQLVRHKAESLGRLAGALAHEYNNLLASMQGRAELALAHLEAAHPAQQHLQAVEQGLRASAGLVRQLTGFAKGTNGPAPSPCDLNAVVQEALALVPLDCRKGKAVVLDLAEGVPAAHLDREEVRQLLLNLLLNAAEAIGPGAGTITVKTRRTRLDAAERQRLLKGRRMAAGDCLLLEVSDTGGGMRHDMVTRIFDPFYTTKPGGRGLGMAVAMGIISRHQGGLAVESREGAGSVIRCYFPACAAAAEAVEPPAAARSAAVWRILVVDDEDTVRRAVAGLLQLRGCEVAQADGYDAALALLDSEGPFDGAVIDMSMPGRGGWETLAGLRAAQPCLNAVMMSGCAISAAEAGFPGLADVQVLDKPFTKEKLYKALFR